MYIYQRSNGTWYISLPNGRRRSLATKDRRVAEQKLAAHKRVVLRGEINLIDQKIKSGLLLSDLLNKYISVKPLAESSVKNYQSAVSKLTDFIGDIQAGSVNDEHLKEFVNGVKARGAKPVSINTYLRHLKVLFGYAVSKKLITDLPEFPQGPQANRFPRILSKDEIDLVLLHARHCDREIYRYIKFALWTGCRRAEIYGLRWERVFDDHCLVIGKGDRERTVPLLPGATEAIGTARQGNNGHVFHRYQNLDTVTKKFKAIAVACELDNVHFHNLRHTAATLMLASGIDIYYVKEMLGHSDIKTTGLYAKVLSSKLKTEMQKFRI